MSNITVRKQENWANAYETRDSISLISYAGSTGLSSVISAKIHSSNVRRSQKSRKIHKNAIFDFKVVQSFQ